MVLLQNIFWIPKILFILIILSFFIFLSNILIYLPILHKHNNQKHLPFSFIYIFLLNHHLTFHMNPNQNEINWILILLLLSFYVLIFIHHLKKNKHFINNPIINLHPIIYKLHNLKTLPSLNFLFLIHKYLSSPIIMLISIINY